MVAGLLLLIPGSFQSGLVVLAALNVGDFSLDMLIR